MSDTSSGTPAGDKADTVMADYQSQTGSTEVERRRVTIHDLPPEIVLAIVEQVDLISAQDRVWPTAQHNPGGGGGGAAAGGGGGGANGAAGDQAGGGGGALNAAELFADMFNGLLGGLPQAGGAAAPAPVPPARTAGVNNAPTANNGQQDDDDDDEMPPLEPLPNAGRAANTTTTAPATAGTAPRTQQQQGNDDDDEMPPLQPINAPPAAAATAARPAPTPTAAAAPAPAPAAAAAATGNARAGSSFLSAFSNPLAAFAGLTGANRNNNNNNNTASASTSTSPRSPTAAPAPAPAAAARGGGDDDDDMPPLEPINPATNRAPAATPAAAAAAPPRATPPTHPTASAARATRNVVDDDDEMPPLEPIEEATSSTSRGSARRSAATPSAARPAATAGNNNDDDDDMPPLEPINASSTSSAAAAGSSSSTTGTRQKAKKSGEETEDDMPELEPIASNRVADRSRLTSSSSSNGTGAGAAPAAAATATTTTGGADDDDELPPLEPLDDLPSTSRPSNPAPASTPAPATASTAARGDDDEEMPPLEPLDEATPATVAPTGAPADANASAATTGGGGPDDSGDDDDNDDEDEDDEEEWESDEDDDDDDDDDEDDDDDDFVLDDDEDRIFVDGLPSDPVVPLALVNRPFLHAARKVLYRHVAVPSPYVAVLIRETLSRPDLAGFVDGDKVLLPTKEYDDGKTKLVRNVLCDMVHSLTFTLETDCSLGRGGGRVYIDLIRMCAANLELLTLRPMFLASATKPLLEAFAELKRLKQVDINSSTDPKRPFIVTTARVYKLLQQSWLDLERLVITDLKPAEDGPEDEVEEMWDLSDAAADAEYDRLKIEKKAGEGDDDDDESENKDEGDKVEKDTVVSKRPRGLKDLQLLGFNVTGTELELILQDSKQTLQALTLQRPNYLFKRADLASTLLTFGHNLTSLDLYLPQTWDPVPKLLPGQSRPPFPVRPKDHKVGEPAKEYVERVGKYTYLLDAVMPCLPNLTRLRFDGPHASAHVFAWFPEKLKTVSFSNCPTISPGTLVKVLNKTLTRTKQITRKDGSVGTKSFQTKAARGMKCLTVTNDDLNWSESEIGALQDTLDERDCCLHLTSDGVHGGFFPIFGLGLGGLFGGAQRPGGAAAAQPAARRQRNNAAGL